MAEDISQEHRIPLEAPRGQSMNGSGITLTLNDGTKTIQDCDVEASTWPKMAVASSVNLSTSSSNETSQAPTSNLLRRANTEIITSIPQPSQPALTLAEYGIKVRDFAYESTLPPIAPVPRLPQQIQPGPRSLKRARTKSDAEDDTLFEHNLVEVGQSQSGAAGPSDDERDIKKPKPLERKVTEPAVENNQRYSIRARGRTDFNHHQPSLDNPPSRGRTPVRTLHLPSLTASLSFSSPSLQPPLQFASQESELCSNTPLITPNASQQWSVIDNSCIPASQLDTNSQAVVPDIVSYSQLSFVLDESETPLWDTSPIRFSSPLSPTPSSPPLTESDPPAPPAEPSRLLDSIVSPRGPRRGQRVNISPARDPDAPPTSSRYFLRKRPSPSRHTQATPSPLPIPPFSMQAAHSKKSTSSPSRPIRQSPAKKS